MAKRQSPPKTKLLPPEQRKQLAGLALAAARPIMDEMMRRKVTDTNHRPIEVDALWSLGALLIDAAVILYGGPGDTGTPMGRATRDMDQEIGKNLRAIAEARERDCPLIARRRQLALASDALARRVPADLEAVWGWENGVSAPNERQLDAYAAALGLPADQVRGMLDATARNTGRQQHRPRS